MPLRSPTHLIVLAPTVLYRAAWGALLTHQPDIRLLGAVAEVAQVSPLTQLGQPTTILVDPPLSPPEPSEQSLAAQLTAAAPGCGLLFLVRGYDLAEVLPLLQAGVTGCISRDEAVAELARAIIAVGRGEIALPPSVAGRALAALARGETGGEEDLVEPLSEREVEVLRLLAQGLTNKDIAQTLILSVRTVEAHLRNIFGKLGVRSRTEAALWAVKRGYGGEA
ncbi:MAG: DNA-binding response regulator [Anaerolineae bacterium]